MPDPPIASLPGDNDKLAAFRALWLRLIEAMRAYQADACSPHPSGVAPPVSRRDEPIIYSPPPLPPWFFGGHMGRLFGLQGARGATLTALGVPEEED